MGFSINKMHEHFVGAIEGIDLKSPLSNFDIRKLNHALDEFGVLVFRNQILTNEQQIKFSEAFGNIELAVGGNVTKEKDRRLSLEIADVSNLDKDGKIFARNDRRRMFNLGNRLWHSDSSYRKIPAKCSLLSCHSKPSSGGNTEFAFMPAAYDALDDKIKKEIGYSGKFNFNLSKPDGTMKKLTDVSKLNNLGWKHSIDIDQGISRIYAWYLS